MCGLSFLLAPAVDSDRRRQRMQLSLQRIAHRGPDEVGVVDGAGWTAGHNRLAIIDLNGGHQPMRDPSGRYVLVFNGEIYNYRDLAADFSSRWTLRDNSDTEVLLAGLILDGPRFLQRLLGMWAFALYDTQAGTLMLARDIVGKKPLYYSEGAGHFACASELPALRALLPDNEWNEDLDSTADFFSYGYALPGRTAFAGVREVLPGHYLVRNNAGVVVETRHWTPSLAPFDGGFRDAADALAEKLDRAIVRRLVADVEVGAFLSGGVDSSLVVACAQRTLSGRLKTYTVGFAERSFDERGHAAAVALHFGTRHTAGEVQAVDAREMIDDLLDHLDQPFGDSSIVPTAMVAKLAARDLKVVLSGDGSDELFAGYSRYLGRRFHQWFGNVPTPIRRSIAAAVGLLPETVDHHSGSLRKKAQLFVALSREAERAASYIAPRQATAARTNFLVPALASRGYGAYPTPWPDHVDDVTTMMRADLLAYLPQDILAKVDRATMASSLEARCPFLDKEVIELALRVPRHWHLGPFKGKRLLRAACGDWIPASVWNRRKQGFGSPVGYWFKGWLGEQLEQELRAGTTGALDASAALALLSEHRRGIADHSSLLWMSYSYSRWHRGLAVAGGD
jgi:asparagine synthase (glutamine-hydrolysing)